MNRETIAELLAIGSQDKEGNIEVLKKTLADNDYKQTFEAAQVFFGECRDLGMTDEEFVYWQSVSLNLPKQFKE
jgi:hypothetical protein